MNRRGEQLGWLVGWAGAFCWLLVCMVWQFSRGHWLDGIVTLTSFALASAAILALAPWRHPQCPYWKLMVPLQVLLALAVCWVVASSDGAWSGYGIWSVLPMTAVLVPLLVMGMRTWDGSAHQGDSAGSTGQAPS